MLYKGRPCITILELAQHLAPLTKDKIEKSVRTLPKADAPVLMREALKEFTRENGLNERATRYRIVYESAVRKVCAIREVDFPPSLTQYFGTTPALPRGNATLALPPKPLEIKLGEASAQRMGLAPHPPQLPPAAFTPEPIEVDYEVVSEVRAESAPSNASENEVSENDLEPVEAGLCHYTDMKKMVVHDLTLELHPRDGMEFTPMNTLCTPLGKTPKDQIERAQREGFLVRKLMLEDSRGIKQDHWCLRWSDVPNFVGGMSLRGIPDHLKPRFIAFRQALNQMTANSLQRQEPAAINLAVLAEQLTPHLAPRLIEAMTVKFVEILSTAVTAAFAPIQRLMDRLNPEPTQLVPAPAYLTPLSQPETAPRQPVPPAGSDTSFARQAARRLMTQTVQLNVNQSRHLYISDLTKNVRAALSKLGVKKGLPSKQAVWNLMEALDLDKGTWKLGEVSSLPRANPDEHDHYGYWGVPTLNVLLEYYRFHLGVNTETGLATAGV